MLRPRRFVFLSSLVSLPLLARALSVGDRFEPLLLGRPSPTGVSIECIAVCDEPQADSLRQEPTNQAISAGVVIPVMAQDAPTAPAAERPRRD